TFPPRRRAVVAGHEGDLDAATGLLDHAEAATRASALGALARLGALTPAHLHQALSDSSPVVRRRAAALAVLHPGVSLLGLLVDDDDSVVEQAAWACGEREPPEAGVVEALAGVVRSHADPLCREAAVAALGAIGDDAGLAAVLAGTEDRATVRRRAVIALAPFSGPEVDAALARAAGDRDWQVRQAAEDQLR
ncbi:MAG: HEAT repeat domain-containing protein, partial [Actinobacteria bacterium]|nr:HEAT repeat domain-containing protein [Actinomycetota bacterium]